MEKVALVLSGGGSKGAYEAGVYKALKKMGKKIDIVTGTSIGAVNGMFIVQRSLRKLLKFWKTVNFSILYKEDDFPKMDDPTISKVYYQYAKAFINEGGMDVSKIENMFDIYYKPNRFFSSNIDYGVVTYNFSKKKPVIMKKKDLNKLSVKDYVIASASCYPAFKPYVIDGDLYIDGGYYDNLPINLAIDLGATEIIAVDLRAVGFKKKVKDESVNITYISPRNKIASFLVFDRKCSSDSIKYGYNDTMKVYGKLDGKKFTFRKNDLIKNYNRYNDLFEDNLNSIFDDLDSPLLNKIFKLPLFKDILNRNIRYNNFNDIVEKTGEFFKFEEYNIYNIRSFNKGLLNSLSNVYSIDIELIKNNIKNKNNIFESTSIIKYFYNCIKNNDMSMLKFILLFKDEFLSAVYIYTVKGLRVNY